MKTYFLSKKFNFPFGEYHILGVFTELILECILSSRGKFLRYDFNYQTTEETLTISIGLSDDAALEQQHFLKTVLDIQILSKDFRQETHHETGLSLDVHVAYIPHYNFVRKDIEVDGIIKDSLEYKMNYWEFTVNKKEFYKRYAPEIFEKASE